MYKKCEKSDLTLKFESPEAAEHFKSWLCGQGEQDYWLWMDCQPEEERQHTAEHFDYWGDDPNVVSASRKV